MNIPELSDRPRLALIAGPTASGKSALALTLAERENGVIVNADASQVYADLRILTARPSAQDEARVPHLLYGYRDAGRAWSAADWAADARAAIETIVKSGRLPILVGGTGLYLRTLLDGIAPIPAIDPDIRAAIRAMTGREAHAALQHEDVRAAAALHPNDTARCQRALETFRSTGRSILDWRAFGGDGIGPHYRLDVRRIDVPIADLVGRCDRRIDRMLAGGAIEEVAALAGRRLDAGMPAMRALGVKPIMAFLRREISLMAARHAICVATHQYAKRQRTWFRNQVFAGETRSIPKQEKIVNDPK